MFGLFLKFQGTQGGIVDLSEDIDLNASTSSTS